MKKVKIGDRVRFTENIWAGGCERNIINGEYGIVIEIDTKSKTDNEKFIKAKAETDGKILCRTINFVDIIQSLNEVEIY